MSIRNQLAARRTSTPGQGSGPETAGGGTPDDAASGTRRKVARRWRVLLAATLVVVAIPVAYIADLATIHETQTVKLTNVFPAEETRPEARTSLGQPFLGGPATAINLLVLGTDRRAAETADAENGVPSNQRSDTMMLVHIPADRKNIYSMSLMRDLWVDIPGHGNAKINAALAYGGVPLLVQTVESIFDQRIDHVAMVDFSGFKELTDALGGVTVNVKEPFTSSHGTKHQFTAGANTLDGDQALQFVRERYAFIDGDYQRVRNQQAFVKAVLGKVFTPATLANPLAVHNALSAVAPHVSVDSGLDAVTLGQLALSLRDVRRDGMMFFTLPTAGTGTSADGQSIVLTDGAAIAEIRAALAEDAFGDYVSANNLTKGN